MMGINACYSCGKPGHMVKDCPIMKSLEKRKERVQSNGPSKEAPGGNDSLHSCLGVQGKAPLVKSRVSRLN